jgi:glutamate carboxypeptidase
MRTFLALCLLLLPAAAPAAELDAIERQLVAHVESHRDEALELLRRVVDINSGTLDLAGVRQVGDIFSGELAALGFTTRWIDGTAFQRAGHLVAERDGAGPHVLLIGHLDTVFEADSPFQRWERVDATHARGPGVVDMKGGDVVMLFALRALLEASVLDDLRLTVVMTGDEERSGSPLAVSREVLETLEADAAIGFEDGDGDPSTAVVSRRGSSAWELQVTGVPAHSSQVFQPEVGAGAIFEASRILTGFYDALRGDPDLTFNPGLVLGGTQVEFDSTQARGTAFGKNNVVAEHAVVAGDLRALSPEAYAAAQAGMRDVVARHLPRTHAELTFLDSYPPLAPTAGNRELLALYSRASEDLGYGPVAQVDPRNAGAADVSFVAARITRVLDGIGLMGTGGHTVEETADLATLPSQTARAALLLYRLSCRLAD